MLVNGATGVYCVRWSFFAEVPSAPLRHFVLSNECKWIRPSRNGTSATRDHSLGKCSPCVHKLQYRRPCSRVCCDCVAVVIMGKKSSWCIFCYVLPNSHWNSVEYCDYTKWSPFDLMLRVFTCSGTENVAHSQYRPWLLDNHVYGLFTERW